MFVWYREVQHENSLGLKGLQGILVCTHENTLLLFGRATAIKTTNIVNVIHIGGLGGLVNLKT